MSQSVALLADQKPLAVNGCVSLHQWLLRTAVDEQLHVLTFTKLRHGFEGHSFHFEQVPFRSMQTRLRYRRDGRTDKRLFSFI